MIKSLVAFGQKRPLLAILIGALIFRLAAAVFAQGYIHSDDHFETVDVAYRWLFAGYWDDQGHLQWGEISGANVFLRFPLYTLFLNGIMWLYYALGVSSLATMMYGVRLIHALIALLPVWAIYRTVELETKSTSWALLAGAMAALHFAMPLLGVRNLIEMVGGNIFIVAIYFLYRWRHDHTIRWLYWAGVFTGLAWMIRFQLAFAVLPIPLLLWIEGRSIRPAVHYSIAVGAMILLSGIIDWVLLGSFGASTLNNITLNSQVGTVYSTIEFLYPLLLLGIVFAPLSLFLVFFGLRWSFLRRHLVLISSIASFVVIHMIFTNQQERFMFPILPACILLAALVLHHRKSTVGYFIKPRWIFTAIVAVTVSLNIILLLVLTFGGYGRRGLIEPLVYISERDPSAHILVVKPNQKFWLPYYYGGYETLTIERIDGWSDYEKIKTSVPEKPSIDFIVIYPESSGDIPDYCDSLVAVYGPLDSLKYIGPSMYDLLLHTMNPKHNLRYEAVIYTPSE